MNAHSTEVVASDVNVISACKDSSRKTISEVNFTRAIRCNVSKLQVVIVCSYNLYADLELVTNEFKTCFSRKLI